MITNTLLYHSTSREKRASIQQNGLLSEKSYSAESGGIGSVFFDSLPGSPNETIDIWEVDVTGLSLEPDDTTAVPDDPEWSGHTWWALYAQDVSPERLRLLTPE